MTIRQIDTKQSVEFLRRIMKPGESFCHEVKVMGGCMYSNGMIHPSTSPHPKTYGGWFHDPADLPRALRFILDCNAYVTVNPAEPKFLENSKPTFIEMKKDSCVKDKNILSINYVFIDIDSERKGNSATEQEHASALILRDKVLDGEPDFRQNSLWGSSGNGGWILLCIGENPNTSQVVGQTKRLVAGLAKKYGRKGHNRAYVDANTFPSRAIPLPGTWKCKGVPSVAAPWRPVTVDS